MDSNRREQRDFVTIHTISGKIFPRKEEKLLHTESFISCGIPCMAGVEPCDHKESSYEEDETQLDDCTDRYEDDVFAQQWDESEGEAAYESVCASELREELERLDRHQLLLVQLANKAKRIQEGIEMRQQYAKDSQWKIHLLRSDLEKEKFAEQEKLVEES